MTHGTDHRPKRIGAPWDRDALLLEDDDGAVEESAANASNGLYWPAPEAGRLATAKHPTCYIFGTCTRHVCDKHLFTVVWPVQFEDGCLLRFLVSVSRVPFGCVRPRLCQWEIAFQGRMRQMEQSLCLAQLTGGMQDAQAPLLPGGMG